MSHELEMKDDEARMFYAGGEPWHGLGTKVETEVTAAAAMKLAQLDLVAHKQPIYIKADDDGTVEVADRKAVVRQDGKILGVVGNTYEIIQNAECFDFMDSVVGEGQAIYHTAGSLFDGRRIFITAKLPDDMMVGGQDKVTKYLLLSSSHDGTLSLQMRFTPIRVVCNNTLSAALNCRGRECSGTISIRHTANYKDKVAIAREALGLAAAYYKRMEVEFNKMLDATMKSTATAEFVENLLPYKVDGDKNAIETTRTKNMREKILSLSQTGAGIGGIKDTRYAAYNAVTEFTTHHRTVCKSVRGGVEDNRMNSIVWGASQRLRQKAYDLLCVN